jgi:UTP--glucose-1-phosphate uridylyltransferase
MIKNIIPSGIKITSVRQNDPLGLGHAILCARHLLHDEPFAVLLPDVFVLDQVSRAMNLSFRALISSWEKAAVGQIMVERVDSASVENYGVVDLGGSAAVPFVSVEIKKLIEKPSSDEAPSDLAIIGRYILPWRVMDLLHETKAGVGGEIQLTDALDRLLIEQQLSAILTDASIFDCGNKEGYLGANIAMAMRDSKIKAYLNELWIKNDW